MANLRTALSRLLVGLLICTSLAVVPIVSAAGIRRSNDDTSVLILGGGVAGVIAARTLHEHGITNFTIVEAHSAYSRVTFPPACLNVCVYALILCYTGELGGRLHSRTFGAPGREVTLEMGALFSVTRSLHRDTDAFARGPLVVSGANWVQGTQTGDGPANPIWTLAKKHQLKTQFNDWYGSISKPIMPVYRVDGVTHAVPTETYDYTGAVDYLDVFNDSEDAYENLTVAAGARVEQQLVDGTARTGYNLVGAKSMTPHASASEYYQFDWEYAQTPTESSWIASSWVRRTRVSRDAC